MLRAFEKDIPVRKAMNATSEKVEPIVPRYTVHTCQRPDEELVAHMCILVLAILVRCLNNHENMVILLVKFYGLITKLVSPGSCCRGSSQLLGNCARKNMSVRQKGRARVSPSTSDLNLVAIDELLCMKNESPQIAMDFS